MISVFILTVDLYLRVLNQYFTAVIESVIIIDSQRVTCFYTIEKCTAVIT